MLSKISSVTLNWSQRPWIHISPITIKHGLFAQAPIWRAVGGLWLVQIKSAASRLFEPQAKHYSPWTHCFCFHHHHFVFYWLYSNPSWMTQTVESMKTHHVSMSLPTSPGLLWRFYDDNIRWTEDGFHNEYSFVSGRWGMHWLDNWSFQKNPFFPRKQFGGVIKFQNQIWFQRGPGTYLHWNCFLFTPTVHVFPCVPIVRDPFCCLKTKHYTPLCVYLMCWFCCPGGEREKERQEKQKRREDCQADIWGTGI